MGSGRRAASVGNFVFALLQWQPCCSGLPQCGRAVRIDLGVEGVEFRVRGSGGDRFRVRGSVGNIFRVGVSVRSRF